MKTAWQKFDEKFKVKEVQKKVKKLNKKTEKKKNFKKVPHSPTEGYEVCVEKIELKESKAGNPMVTVWFRIIEGEFKNHFLFYNQIVKEVWQIQLANNFLENLKQDFEISFESYSQYGKLLEDLEWEVKGQLAYKLLYAEGKNGFSTFEIVEWWETV